jgi:acetyl-CoA acetyltransferase
LPDPHLAGASIVGAYETPYRRQSESTPLELATEAVIEACRGCGLTPADLDGLAVTSFQLAPDNVVTAAEHLGIPLKWAWQGAHGGASGVVSIIQAAEAITLGRADAIACVASDAFTVSSHVAMLEHFNSGMRDYIAPYGFGGANGIFALVEQAHRAQFGTTREQLGRIAVAQRQSAGKNPNALLRDPMTLDDYLEARLIADPVRLYDCVLPCAGADAVLLLSTERANELGLPHIEVLAGGQRHNFLPLEVLSLRTGAADFSAQLFQAAGVDHAELDFVQLYDDYPIMVLIQLEDLGFADKGAGGAFVEQTDFTLDGNLPLNTGGGQLSAGQAGAAGGMIGSVEAVVQLLGQAGERQLDGPTLGLVSGFGMVGYGKGLSSAAMIVRRA